MKLILNDLSNADDPLRNFKVGWESFSKSMFPYKSAFPCKTNPDDFIAEALEESWVTIKGRI